MTAGKSFFSNNEKKWGDEVEMWVTSDTYKKEMGIPPKEDLPKWNDLKEGQVYLSGHFEIVGKRESPEKFKVNTKVKDFLQIDEFVKKDIKELYFKVLKKGK
ncbi:MAG: hypothetical protein JXB26_13280 [Candidatus Aminicenantes bacterium]|nr:hypothetical protein [Candidatus Aminicenantes bacterium]